MLLASGDLVCLLCALMIVGCGLGHVERAFVPSLLDWQVLYVTSGLAV